jgi:hypothetical protein
MNQEIFNSLIGPSLTSDGLLPCKLISINNESGRTRLFFSDKGIEVFPVSFNLMAIRYLAKYPHLWEQAEIRVTFGRSMLARAPVFGVPFQKAVKIALTRGKMRSKFYFPGRIENQTYETLLIQLDQINDAKGNLLQLQAWQHSPCTQRAHYIHALSPDFETHIYHLDGAIIEYSPEDLDIFLQQSRKVKGHSYNKFFRLDGKIEIEHMHSLAKSFFLTEDLYDEAFEVSS